MEDKIIINGDEYTKAEKPGELALVVLPHGFIFVGTVERDGQTVKVSSCVNVRSWKRGGLGGLTKGAASSGAVLDPCATVEVAESAVVFICALAKGWIDA